jgi:hypothetical protein
VPSRALDNPALDVVVELGNELGKPLVPKSLPADGGGWLASVAAQNSRRFVAGIGPLHGAINPQWTMVLWSFVIFGGRRPGAALVEITVLLVAVAMTAMRFAELSRLAFWLMTPYFAWALYASYLNFGILRLNKGTA